MNNNLETKIYVSNIVTPLGDMLGCATDIGVCFLEYTTQSTLNAELDKICKILNAKVIFQENSHLRRLQFELFEYFAKKRKMFHVKLHIIGTEFQQLVWDMLKTIPYGQTVSYKVQSMQLNSPRAIRAVASANGHNKIPIVIPCHRVIGSNGSLTGYAGGIHRKKWLLDFEKSNN